MYIARDFILYLDKIRREEGTEWFRDKSNQSRSYIDSHTHQHESSMHQTRISLENKVSKTWPSRNHCDIQQIRQSEAQRKPKPKRKWTESAEDALAKGTCCRISSTDLKPSIPRSLQAARSSGSERVSRPSFWIILSSCLILLLPAQHQEIVLSPRHYFFH
jgi:hypothetical protein